MAHCLLMTCFSHVCVLVLQDHLQLTRSAAAVPGIASPGFQDPPFSGYVRDRTSLHGQSGQKTGMEAAGLSQAVTDEKLAKLSHLNKSFPEQPLAAHVQTLLLVQKEARMHNQVDKLHTPEQPMGTSLCQMEMRRASQRRRLQPLQLEHNGFLAEHSLVIMCYSCTVALLFCFIR